MPLAFAPSSVLPAPRNGLDMTVSRAAARGVLDILTDPDLWAERVWGHGTVRHFPEDLIAYVLRCIADTVREGQELVTDDLIAMMYQLCAEDEMFVNGLRDSERW